MYLDNKLDWSTHTTAQYKKAQTRLYFPNPNPVNHTCPDLYSNKFMNESRQTFVLPGIIDENGTYVRSQ